MELKNCRIRYKKNAFIGKVVVIALNKSGIKPNIIFKINNQKK